MKASGWQKKKKKNNIKRWKEKNGAVETWSELSAKRTTTIITICTRTLTHARTHTRWRRRQRRWAIAQEKIRIYHICVFFFSGKNLVCSLPLASISVAYVLAQPNERVGCSVVRSLVRSFGLVVVVFSSYSSLCRSITALRMRRCLCVLSLRHTRTYVWIFVVRLCSRAPFLSLHVTIARATKSNWEKSAHIPVLALSHQ